MTRQSIFEQYDGMPMAEAKLYIHKAAEYVTILHDKTEPSDSDQDLARKSTRLTLQEFTARFDGVQCVSWLGAPKAYLLTYVNPTAATTAHYVRTDKHHGTRVPDEIFVQKLKNLEAHKHHMALEEVNDQIGYGVTWIGPSVAKGTVITVYAGCLADIRKAHGVYLFDAMHSHPHFRSVPQQGAEPEINVFIDAIKGRNYGGFINDAVPDTSNYTFATGTDPETVVTENIQWCHLSIGGEGKSGLPCPLAVTKRELQYGEPLGYDYTDKRWNTQYAKTGIVRQLLSKTGGAMPPYTYRPITFPVKFNNECYLPVTAEWCYQALAKPNGRITCASDHDGTGQITLSVQESRTTTIKALRDHNYPLTPPIPTPIVLAILRGEYRKQVAEGQEQLQSNSHWLLLKACVDTRFQCYLRPDAHCIVDAVLVVANEAEYASVEARIAGAGLFPRKTESEGRPVMVLDSVNDTLVGKALLRVKMS